MRVNYQIRVSVLGGSYINIMCMVLNNKAAMVIDLLDSNCTDGVCGNDYYPFKSRIHALAFMLRNGPRPMVCCIETWYNSNSVLTLFC